MVSTSTKAANACSSTIARRSGMGTPSAKYGCQKKKPVNSSTSRHSALTQNTSFCPALYLATGGMPASWPRSISGVWRSHSVSVRRQRFSCQTAKKIGTNASTIARPRKGWRMRLQTPPPNSPDNGNSAGWNSARPDNPAAKNRSATTQWVRRVRSS